MRSLDAIAASAEISEPSFNPARNMGWSDFGLFPQQVTVLLRRLVEHDDPMIGDHGRGIKIRVDDFDLEPIGHQSRDSVSMKGGNLRRTRSMEPGRQDADPSEAKFRRRQIHNGVKNSRCVVDAPGDQTDRVETRRQRDHAFGRQKSETRFDGRDPAIGGWSAQRPSGLGAQSKRQEAGGDSRGRAAAGSTRRMCQPMGIACFRWVHERKFSGYRLADGRRARCT